MSSRCFLSSFKLIGLSIQEKDKIDFQNGSHGCHLGFQIGTILVIIDVQHTLILPIKFPFGSGEAQTRFHGGHP